MGAYVVQADVEAIVKDGYLIAMTNDDPDAVAVDTDVFDAVVAEAEAEVNAYLGRRYTLPLSVVPVLITRLTARLTRYLLYTSTPGDIKEWLIKDYERIVSKLEQIRDGELDLGLDSGGDAVEATPNTGTAVRASSRAPVFGRDNMGGF